MTIRTKRRGRTLAALLATMLMASVLAVVAGGPAQAANTSGEMLVPVDSEFYLRVYDDGVLVGREYQPDMTREFAGTHRYNTSVALGERYAAESGSVSTVIIASGESQVDAVAAAGLAGYLDAPVLLTRGDRLPHNVARFIDRHNVVDVIVVGGTAAISDSVLTTIEGLGSGPDVERVSGANRYETAAAIGDFLGGPAPTWCGSNQSAAILVNGSDAGRADAVAIGPLAYALGLPILLTSADGLHEAASTFLTDNEVERVVVVGGTSSVPDSIIDELIEDVGVVNSRRISGGSAAGTSVAIAQEMLNPNRCGDVLDTDADLVALVNRDATADGITAGPTMGQGLGNGAVPILLVGDELPAEVMNYLASTAESRGGMKTHLSIVAVGGSAVVSTSVMSAAVAAAKTSPDLTATIAVVDASAGTFSVTYSDDVLLPRDDNDNIVYTGDPSDPTTANIVDDTVLDPTLYRINGRRIDGDQATANEVDFVVNKVEILDRTVTVTVSHPLANGDVISVVGGAKVGANKDLRPLQPASHTVSVAAPARDRAGPTVEIIAIAGQAGFDVIVTDASTLLQHPATTSNYMHQAGISLNGVSMTSTDPAATITAVAAQTASGRPDGTNATNIRYRFTTPVLSVNDRIEIKANTFRDKFDQGNRVANHNVKAPRADFEITSIAIGDVTQVAAATAVIGAAADGIEITGKKDGLAAGALGNEWVIYGYRDPDSTGADTTDVTVAVDTKHSVITYTITTPGPIVGQPNLYHLASRLVANDDFSANFTLAYGGTSSTSNKLQTFGDSNVGIDFTNGQSSVVVRANFNDVAEGLGSSGAGNTDTGLSNAINHGRDITGLTEAGTVTVLFVSADRMAYFTYTTAAGAEGVATLPAQGGARVIPASVVNNFYQGDHDNDTDTAEVGADGTADGNAAEILRQLRRGL